MDASPSQQPPHPDPIPTAKFRTIINDFSFVKILRETPINWALAFTDPTERHEFASYLDKIGPPGQKKISLCGMACYAMFFCTLLMEPSGQWKFSRMCLAGGMFGWCAVSFGCCVLGGIMRRWWGVMTGITVGLILVNNVVTLDVLYTVSGLEGVQPMEDVATHLTLAACMFIMELHPYVPIGISTAAVATRTITSAFLYDNNNTREVATLGISLAATLIPVHVSLICYRINEAWIFHMCRTHQIDMRVLDVRHQYDIRYRIRRGSKDLKGHPSVHTIREPKRTWRKWWRRLFLQWDDAQMEERHRVLSYEAGWTIVLTYTGAYLVKHIVVSAINDRMDAPDAITVYVALLVEAGLIILYHLMRRYHRDFHTLYAFICMGCTTVICLAFLWQGIPNFQRCCVWNAVDLYDPRYLSDQRAHFYEAVCPVTSQMFNVGLLFRLPFSYQTFFAALLPLVGLGALQARSLFWPFNFGLCFVVSVSVSYATEVQQRRVVRLEMLLRDNVDGMFKSTSGRETHVKSGMMIVKSVELSEDKMNRGPTHDTDDIEFQRVPRSI
ncbi:hypothetical protein HDV00_007826 [Rhizophlyctis rosea]|nr:hypothetical protein HDV00_007826 [Rhizophlyctis rosea]